MRISVIVPTFNEAATIEGTIEHLKSASGSVEIIVPDGGSEDDTLEKAYKTDADHVEVVPKRGRAAQMNHGAALASGDILYFVHADTYPPLSYPFDIEQAVQQGYRSGCYRLRFDPPHPLLRINAFFTRFDRMEFRGGDQTFFIDRRSFRSVGGFNEEMAIMEDYDMIRKAREHAPFRILPRSVTASARKYDRNSYFRVLYANFIAMRMFKAGHATDRILERYKHLLHRKTKGYGY